MAPDADTSIEVVYYEVMRTDPRTLGFLAIGLLEPGWLWGVEPLLFGQARLHRFRHEDLGKSSAGVWDYASVPEAVHAGIVWSQARRTQDPPPPDPEGFKRKPGVC